MPITSTFYLLLVLTQNGAGDVHASFVNATSLEECRISQAMLKGVFAAQGITLLYGDCRASKMQFTVFNHALSTSTERYFYLIDTDHAKSLLIEPQPHWRACRIAQRHVSESGGTGYCATSTQRLLDAGK